MMTVSNTSFTFSITMTFTFSQFDTISGKISLNKGHAFWEPLILITFFFLNQTPSDPQVASRKFARSTSLRCAGYQWRHSRGPLMYSCRSMSPKMTSGDYHAYQTIHWNGLVNHHYLLQPSWSEGWNRLSIPKGQRCSRCSLGMDK